MAENKQEKAAENRTAEQGQAFGAGAEDVPYDMTVAGHPDETLWDNMVNAVKPDLTPGKKKG